MKQQEKKKRNTSSEKKHPRSSIFIKVLLLILILGAGWQIGHLHQDVQRAESIRQELAQQVKDQQRENASLKADIKEGSTTEKMKELARDELGYVESGEYVFEIIGAG